MKKHYLHIPTLTGIWLLTTPIHATQPTADDFLPPIQASTTEQQQQLTQIQAPVQQVTDPTTGKTVAQGQTTQDTINFVVNKHSAGAEMIKVGSGSGWVATGIGGYEMMENPTATRIAKRNAYVRAFLEAKKNLAETLNGLNSKGRNQILEQMEQVTDNKADLADYSNTQEEKLEQAVQMLLTGFVVYTVADDVANKTVYVSIVTTPKTRGKFNRVSPYGIEANSMRDGLNQVLLEIQNGLIPPVGGKMIQVPVTGEMAFVGFGSDIIRSSANSALQMKMRLNATKIAQMRAKDALLGMIIGDDTQWKSRVDETTLQTIKQFEASDNAQDKSVKRFEQTRQNFLNVQKSSEQFQSIRQGVLPPGVVTKTYTSKDNAEMYAVSVYIPSLTNQAQQAAQEMQQMQPLTVVPASPLPEKVTTDNNVVPSPGHTITPGPTGPISRDQDL